MAVDLIHSKLQPSGLCCLWAFLRGGGGGDINCVAAHCFVGNQIQDGVRRRIDDAFDAVVFLEERCLNIVPIP